ncbi:MAG: carboxypeptidase regulatory-like domain-containing protein [Nannocystales bacterium]
MSERASRRRGLAALVVLFLLGGLVALAWRSDDPLPEGEPAPALPGSRGSISAEPVFTQVQGRVLFEGTLPEDTPWGDPELTPATECRVRVWQQNVEVAESSSCGPQGRYVASLGERITGRVSVEIEAPGRLRAVITVDLPESGPGVLPDVALGMAQRVRGSVVNLRGDPMPGVVVEARPIPDLGEAEPWRRVTGEGGSFDFDTLPPGPVALRASPPGHAPTVVEAIAPQDEVLLRLGGLYDVKGRVLAAGTDADVGTATIRLEGSGVWPARVVEVEPDGSFVVPAVPDGVYSVEAIVADEPGEPAFASLPLEGVEPDLEVTLALLPAQWVPVEVEDPDGAAVADARVTLMNAQVGMLGRSASTGEDGRAWLGPVVPGPYIARADADAWLASAPEALQVDDAAVDPVVLRLARPGRLVVTVLDPAGDPVKGAQVALRTDAVYSVGEAQTRAATFARTAQAAGTLGVVPGPVPPVPLGDGSGATAWRRSARGGAVAFEGLVPGSYTVTASHSGFAASAERTLTVPAGESVAITLMLRAGQPLTGRVRDSNDRPIEGAQVRVGDVLLARTDDRGVYDAGPHAGSVRVEVRATGFAAQTENVRIRKEPVDVEWVLEEADSVLIGQVSGGNDRPVAGVRVSVHPRGGVSQTTWTEADGAFRFEGLPRGRVEVRAEHEDYVPWSGPLRVEGDTPLDITLVEGWSTTIVVRWSGSLEPVVAARVRGGGADAVTDARGDAVLTGLARDSVRLEISGAGAPRVRRAIKRGPAAGRDVFVELVLGGRLQGRVTDYRGDPVRGADVEVRRLGEDDAVATTRSGRRGSYVFEGLAEGDVEVQAWPPSAREDDLDTEVLRSDVRAGHVTDDVVFKLPRR